MFGFKRRVYRKDPWARIDAWREPPKLNGIARLNRALPGLTWGIGAFLVLSIIDELYWKPKERREEAEWKRTHPHH